MGRIIEEIVEVNNEWELVSQCMPLLHHKDRGRYEYAYLLYLDGKEKAPIIAFCLNELPESKTIGRHDEFARYMKRVTYKTFMDLLFVVDVYERFITARNFTFEEIFEKKPNFTSHTVVDMLLSDSYGYILWNYQLENLIRLFQHDISKIKDFYDLLNVMDMITAFRRGINARKMLFIELADTLKIDKKLSLYDVLSERMLLGCTRDPNIQGALTVYNTFH